MEKQLCQVVIVRIRMLIFSFFALLNYFYILFLFYGFEVFYCLNTLYSFDGPCCNSLDADWPTKLFGLSTSACDC